MHELGPARCILNIQIEWPFLHLPGWSSALWQRGRECGGRTPPGLVSQLRRTGRVLSAPPVKRGAPHAPGGTVRACLSSTRDHGSVGLWGAWGDRLLWSLLCVCVWQGLACDSCCEIRSSRNTCSVPELLSETLHPLRLVDS